MAGRAGEGADKKTGGLNFKPTSAEVELAKKVLDNADSKSRKSKMTSMVAWLKQNAEASGSAEASASRGEQRLAYLQQYLIFQQRKQQGKTMSTSVVNNTKAQYTDFDWMCEHEIRQVFKK